MSTYAVPSRRIGKKTGPRRVRMIATVRLTTRISTQQISITRMLSQRPSRTAGNDETALSQSK